MRLGEIMTENVTTVGRDEAASRAWSRMRDRRIRHLVVMDAGRVVGVLSERDLGGSDGGERRRGRTVRELMSRRVVSATPETTLRRAAGLMRAGPIGSLPVLDDGRLVGIVTASDVLDELGLAQLGLAAAPRVPTYIRTRGVVLSANERAYIRGELGARLGKFASGVERASVRLDDVNGPRGGVDHRCRIKLVLSGRPSIVVEHQAVSARAAVDGAIARAERALGRSVGRRRASAR